MYGGVDMAVNRNSIDMLHGSLWGKIIKFSIFYMMTAFLQHLYSAADVIIVGRYAGEKALAGVGTCTVLVKLWLNFILGLSAGSTIVMGQAIGSGQRDKISHAAHTAIGVAICGGILISFVCIFFANPLLGLIDVPEDVFDEAKDYLVVSAMGYIPSLVYNFGAGLLRAKGDTKRALYIVTASGLINVLLNLFFVCVCKMTAGGVALATVLSQVFTAVCILYILCHEEDETRLSLRKLRIHKEPFLKMLRLGIPSGIQSSVYSLSNMVVQSSVNTFGSAAIAGAAASTSITDFYNVVGSGMYQSAIVFTSQNFGAKKFDRIKQTVRVCFTYVILFWIAEIAITHFFGKTLISLYAPNDPEVVMMGLKKFRINGYFYGLAGVMNVMSGALRGMGASFMNMVTSIAGVCGIRILWVLTAFRAIGTFESLYWCYPLSWLGTFTLHFCMFLVLFQKHKKKNAIEGQGM